jgi:hypothetical protein
VDTLDSNGSLCCRYCGYLFSENEVPKTSVKKFYNSDTKSFEMIEIKWEYTRCPSCLHVLHYEIQSGMPESVVWHDDKKYIRNS